MTATIDDLHKYGFKEMETAELSRKVHVETGYPKPARLYRISYEAYSISIEEPYFWILHYLRYYGGYPHVDKITDIFAASENSAFFGASQQRLGVQQDKVSQYLATIGKMVRELFQLVRELRVLDERLSYYADAYSKSPSAESAEITLKGTWVDMVEQGAKNPASVYGMAREVQFTTLPDLFFSTHPERQEDVDRVVDEQRGKFNRKVKEVLKRKLRSYLAWKEHTFQEVKNRRAFTLKYLRQHFEIIQMYTDWCRPYLKNIQRLQLDGKRNDTPDLLVAFENSMIEVELMARKPGTKVNGKQLNEVLLIHFLFRTRPELNYQQEGYNRGPIHVGRIEASWRAYCWSDEEVENYKKLRQEEDFKLLGVIDGSVQAALDALGDELTRYLREAGEDLPQKIPDEEKQKTPKQQPSHLLTPYLSVFKGIGELASAFSGHGSNVNAPKQPKQIDIFNEKVARSKHEKSVADMMWSIYHDYKKHHGMLSW